MSWLPVDFDTPDKKEVVALSSRLQRDTAECFGRVVMVWIWVQKNTADGRIQNGTLVMVDHAAKLEGFGQALLEVGWCYFDGTYLVFPKWDRYNEHSAKKRMQNAERQRKLRAGPEKKPVARASRPKRDACSVSVLSGFEEGMQGESDTPFDRFWKAYPKRVAKGAAIKAWKANGCDAIVDTIVRKVKKYAKTDDWTKEGRKFCPYPASWLNDKRWNDDDPADPLAHLRRKVTAEEARALVTAPIPSNIKLEGQP